MPRKARIDAPGALHHIIARGIEKKPIFIDQRDYEDFLSRLERLLPETTTPCYAWALMPNHVHLLLRTGLTPISTVMRRLLTGYAQQFNRRHQRHGHLFQNRYKSILCEEKPYFLELIRYIHLNPLRAGIVKTLRALNSYPFCGHGVILGHFDSGFQDIDFVLKNFGTQTGEARQGYGSFVSKGISLGRRPDLIGGGLIRSQGGWAAVKGLRAEGSRIFSDERILGSSDFVEKVLEAANETYAKKTAISVQGIRFKNLLDAVSRRFDMEPEAIKGNGKSKQVARARAIICSLAVDYSIKNGAQIAREMNLTRSSVSKLVYRGRQEVLRKEIEKKLFEESVSK